MMGQHLTRSAWTSTTNQAVAVKRKQVHVTWHYPGFGTDSVRTAGWSLERCFQQLRAWRNMHVGSGAYREVAYNLYALPTGDVVDGRGNRQNGANGLSTANRAGFSVQVLIGDNEPLSRGHMEAILLALVILERWHPGITGREYPHSHWVQTRCPGPFVRGGIPYKRGTTPAVPAPSKPAADSSRPWRASARVAGFSTAEVRRIQGVLLGFDLDLGKWGTDGSYGDATGAAVRTLQQELEITADGVYGPGTETAVATIKKQIDQIHNFVVERAYLDTRTSAARDKVLAAMPDKKQVDQIHDYIVRRGYTDTKTSHAEARIKETVLQAIAQLDPGVDPDKVRAAVAEGVDEALGNLDVTVTRRDGAGE